jgi:two-component sensor histidine kinase
MFSGREQVTRDELLKLTKYVHSLSLIHDVLLREVQQGGTGKLVRLDRILSDLVELYSVEMNLRGSEFPACNTTTRRAATVSLILNELIDNGMKYGSGETVVSSRLTAVGILELAVWNSVPSDEFSESIKWGNGLRISALLSKRDLESELLVTPLSTGFTVKFTAPVDAI